jgi:hypothetical protein
MRLCVECLKRHWVAKRNKKTGLQVKHKNGNLIYICVNCGNVQEEEREFIEPEKRIQANILYIDTENSTSIYENYGRKVYGEYLAIDNLVSPWFMLGWSASYMGDDTVWSGFVSSKDAKARTEKNIVTKLHGLMSTAEIIAGHNVDGFDVKKCNTVFLRHGLPFIVGKKTIDTLKMARTKLSLEGNGLDYISRLLGFDGKDKITRDDWRVATAGDSKTIKRIETYCRGDVLHGKQVLETFLPLANKKYNFGAIKKIPNQPTEEK